MMTFLDARIERAKYLKAVYPFAAEVLDYYAEVCVAQQPLVREVQKILRSDVEIAGRRDLRDGIDVGPLLKHASEVLSSLLGKSPNKLLNSLQQLLREPMECWRTALRDYIALGGTGREFQDPVHELACRILVSPYAELLAAKGTFAERIREFENCCPECAALPVTGVLRAEGDGGKRFLVCSFCGSEWEFRRIVCAYCGEENPAVLPVYIAEDFAHIRLEACETCKRCLSTVDLTKDGRAIPVVDDLAAMPLTLWAEEHGYQRICGNLLGT